VKPTLFLLPLIAALSFGQQADTKQRVKAVHDLGKQGQDAIPRIAPYVSDPDLSVRIEAVKALVEVGGPKTLDPLLKAAADNDPEIQIRATDGLVNVYLPGYSKNGMSGTLQRAGNSIRGKFTDTNDKVIDAYITVRPDVIAALGKLARGGASVDARANAARAVGVLRGRDAIPDLIEALHSKDDAVMYEALIALEKIRDPSAAPRIAFLLRDLDDKIQMAALETTGILRNKEAAPDVRDAMSHARNIKVRRAAMTALSMIADPGDRGVFLRDLNDKDEAIRAAAAEGLARVADPSDKAVLEKAFNDEKKMSPRLSDAFALVAVGSTDTGEFSPLRYLVNSLNQRIYRDVAVAFLTELCRDEKVRRTVYPMLTGATKDEKMQMSIVLSRSGDKDSIPFLETLSVDPDNDVAQQGIRSLRTLRARLP
jgi:HEAT repeat protein